MILPITLKEGRGGIAIEDISAILPDIENPTENCLVYTGLFPCGVSVLGNAEELCAMWYAALVLASDDEEEDEED